MPFEVHVEGSPLRFACPADQSVLTAMRSAGSSSVAVGCRSGGCGVCRVQVLAGSFETGLMSQAEVSDADRAQGIVLACQLFPLSDLHLRALGLARGTSSADTAALIRALCAGAPPARSVTA